MTAKRIAIVVATLESGGAERVALNLANSLSRAGHPIDLVMLRQKGELLDFLDGSVETISLGAERAASAIIPLRRYLKDRVPDAVIVINYELNLALLLAAIGLRARPLIILTVHSAPRMYLAAGHPAWRLVFSRLSQLLYRRADHVVTVSAGIGGELLEMGWVSKGQVRTIHNPVIGEDFSDRESAVISHPWLDNRTMPVLVYVGRLTEAKNLPLLIKSFAIARRHRPMRLLMVGTGELAEQVEGWVRDEGMADAVCLIGYRSNPIPYIARSDGLVLSSSFEGLSNTLIEALGTGTRIVSTDCPYGPREVLDHGRLGRLVPCDDAEALAAAMLAMLADDDTGGATMRRAASRRFDADTIAREYASLID